VFSLSILKEAAEGAPFILCTLPGAQPRNGAPSPSPGNPFSSRRKKAEKIRQESSGWGSPRLFRKKKRQAAHPQSRPARFPPLKDCRRRF
jgi:hypothetical protein